MYMRNSTGKVKRSVYNESSVPERLRDNRSCQEASVWSSHWLKIQIPSQTNRWHVLLIQYGHFANTKEITVFKKNNAFFYI